MRTRLALLRINVLFMRKDPAFKVSRCDGTSSWGGHSVASPSLHQGIPQPSAFRFTPYCAGRVVPPALTAFITQQKHARLARLNTRFSAPGNMFLINFRSEKMKAKLNRDFYRPTANSGYEVFKPKGVELSDGVEIFINFDRCSAVFFSGKRAKPDWHYRYQNLEKLLVAINVAIRGCIDHAARKNAEKQAKASWVHDVKVGEVFRCSWGYDQTNIDYYEVVALLGLTMCEIKEIQQEIIHNGDMHGTCIPLPGHYETAPDYSQEKINGAYPRKEVEARRMRIQCTDGKPYLAIHSFANAYRIHAQEIAPGVKVYDASHWSGGH